MAFRIHESIVRGQIDNRVKGIVRGELWLEGWANPLRLELRGNAHPDLAGCLLTFTYPRPRIVHPHLDSLNPLQRGVIGDLTASRRVRVFDVPMPEALEMIRRNEKPPEHMANCLYLEWFSEANGRVVVESTDYEVTISPPEWRLTPEEEEQRAREASAGMADFIGRLTEAIEAHRRGQKDPEAKWDEHDYEKLLRESDARTDKYLELLDKYGESDEAQARIAELMGWKRDDPAPGGLEWAEEELDFLDDSDWGEPTSEPDPAREGIDWVRTERGDLRHPLQHRCSESALLYFHQVQELGLGEFEDEDLAQFIFEFQTTGAKLAGALSGLANDCDHGDDAFKVALLKRALGHLHKAQGGLEAVAPKGLLPELLVVQARRELFELREGILRLMDELRGRG